VLATGTTPWFHLIDTLHPTLSILDTTERQSSSVYLHQFLSVPLLSLLKSNGDIFQHVPASQNDWY
jgi:hypothetical protein